MGLDASEREAVLEIFAVQITADAVGADVQGDRAKRTGRAIGKVLRLALIATIAVAAVFIVIVLVAWAYDAVGLR